MNRSTQTSSNPRPGGPGLPLAPAALLAAAALLLGALPAFAQGGGAPGEERRIEKRRMMVVSPDEGRGRHAMLTRVLGGAYLGVELMPLTPELRAHFGVPADRGVMVARVREESPAARAGLRVGDVITGVEDAAVDRPWDVAVAVRAREAGDTVTLEAVRDRRALDFAVTVEERDRERIELGRLLEMGEGPHAFRLRERVGPEGGPKGGMSVLIEPEMMERLGESLEKIDWPRLHRHLGERNHELEQRLGELEQRLKELERELRRP